jgi:hypothetical protein
MKIDIQNLLAKNSFWLNKKFNEYYHRVYFSDQNICLRSPITGKEAIISLQDDNTIHDFLNDYRIIEEDEAKRLKIFGLRSN